MALELAARLAVLLACAVAAGALYVRLAGPRRSDAGPGESRPLPGVEEVALAAFVVMAGGTALTGAGVVDAGSASGLLAAAGIALLGATGLLAVRARRLGRRPATGDAARATSPGSLLVLAWAGAALALASSLLGIGAVVVAVGTSARLERRGP